MVPRYSMNEKKVKKKIYTTYICLVDTIETVVFDKYFAPISEIRFGYTYQIVCMSDDVCMTINNVRYMGMSLYTRS